MTAKREKRIERLARLARSSGLLLIRHDAGVASGGCYWYKLAELGGKGAGSVLFSSTSYAEAESMALTLIAYRVRLDDDQIGPLAIGDDSPAQWIED